MKSKLQIRDEMRHKLRTQSEEERSILSGAATDKLIMSPQFHNATSIASYMSLASELDTGYLNEWIMQNGKRLAVPCPTRAREDYGFVWIDSSTRFISGRYGISEPIDGAAAALDMIDMVVLPGLAFSRSGGRIGQGAGVYDRLLQTYRGISVGLAFSFQLVSEVPLEDHDVRCDFLVTDLDFLECNKYNKTNIGVKNPEEKYNDQQHDD